MQARNKSKRSKEVFNFIQQEEKEKIAPKRYARKQNERSFSPANREAARKSNQTNLAHKNRTHLLPHQTRGVIAKPRRRGPGIQPSAAKFYLAIYCLVKDSYLRFAKRSPSESSNRVGIVTDLGCSVA